MKRLNCYRMRLVLFGVVAAIVLGGKLAEADFSYGIWAQKTDMPTPRWKLDTCEVDGKIYVIGGVPTEGTGSRLSTVEEYDPTTDTWTRKADIPMARVNFSASVVSGRIYAIGGSRDGASITEEYDPITDVWTRKAEMPTPRRSLSSCVVNGKIYAIGGTPVSVWSGMKTVEQYDPLTDTWERKADMLTGVWGLCACAINGKIYALGGRPDLEATAYVQEYDPAADTWTRKTNMPVRTSNMASVVTGNKIVVIGGWLHSNSRPHTTVQVYDPKTDIWTIEGDAPFLRACFSAEVVRGRIFAIGGTDRPHPCPATSTVYELTVNPIPDLNGDGIVDSSDMCIMVDYWGTDNSLCDIGPAPWGDGIVDVQDMTVLAEYLFEEVALPEELVAYWRLDEADGDIAIDSARDNDGLLFGNPEWQSDRGKREGSLQFDGSDDYIHIPFVLNPADGEFTICAWIKGGAIGQVIVSQSDGTGFGSTWLGIDQADGKLETNLCFFELASEKVISDDKWHHIGLVWNGYRRSLYVDGQENISDESDLVALSASGDIHIGTSKTLDEGSFFYGLIDDVRIYDVALTAAKIKALLK